MRSAFTRRFVPRDVKGGRSVRVRGRTSIMNGRHVR